MNKLAHLMRDTVTIAIRNGVDNYGDPSFAAQQEIKARVENRQKIMRTMDGNELTANHVFCTLTAIPVGTRVWLPGTDTGVANDSLVPIRIKSAPSITGDGTLYEVWL